MSLHPAVQAIWDRITATGFTGYAGGSVAQARAHFSAASRAFGPGPGMAVETLSIPVAGATIAGRLYQPEGARGLCVYYHGGGWVLGTLDDFDAFCRVLAARAGCAVLSVDYRLAPEHPFPVPVDDAVAALRWAAQRPEATQGLAVSGDSAGGNLAAVAALALRDEVDLVLQLLFNPCTDADPTRPSFAAYGTDHLLTAADVDWFLGHYAPGVDRRDGRLAPLHMPDLTRAAPAFIAVAEHDVLRDEGEAYARALIDAGVPVTLRRVEGVMHGFARSHGSVPPSGAAVSEAAEALRAVLR